MRRVASAQLLLQAGDLFDERPSARALYITVVVLRWYLYSDAAVRFCQGPLDFIVY